MNNLRCDICDFQANTPQGLAGHKQFKHSGAGPVEHASSKHASSKHAQLARVQLESSAHSYDLVAANLLDRLGEAENGLKVAQYKIEVLEQQQVHGIASSLEGCLGQLSALNTKVSQLESQQQAASIDSNRALKEQFDVLAQSVEQALNEQIAPRLHCLEHGYRELLGRGFSSPEVTERKWQEYRNAVGGKALGDRCSLDRRPPIQIKR
ncbi:hypothetical protein ACFLYE_01525 [Chloroflexota bacterium]